MKDQHPVEREQALWLSSEDQARLAAFKAYAVNHALLEDIDTRLTQAILEPAGFAHMLVYGPSGVGKTTMLRRTERRVQELYARMATPSVAAAQWSHPQCIPTKGDRKCGILEGMRTPIFIRPLTEDERQHIQKGLRSSDAFVLRRCQILTASV